jgi:hypothetical protein
MDFWPTEGPAVEDDSNDPEAPQPLTQVYDLGFRI